MDGVAIVENTLWAPVSQWEVIINVYVNSFAIPGLHVFLDWRGFWLTGCVFHFLVMGALPPRFSQVLNIWTICCKFLNLVRQFTDTTASLIWWFGTCHLAVKFTLILADACLQVQFVRNGFSNHRNLCQPGFYDQFYFHTVQSQLLVIASAQSEHWRAADMGAIRKDASKMSASVTSLKC